MANDANKPQGYQRVIKNLSQNAYKETDNGKELIIGIPHGMSEDAIKEIYSISDTMLSNNIEFWEQFFKLSISGRQVVRNLLNQLLVNQNHIGYNFSKIVDFIEKRYGTSLWELADIVRRENVNNVTDNIDYTERQSRIYDMLKSGQDAKKPQTKNLQLMEFICDYFLIEKEVLYYGRGRYWQIGDFDEFQKIFANNEAVKKRAGIGLNKLKEEFRNANRDIEDVLNVSEMKIGLIDEGFLLKDKKGKPTNEAKIINKLMLDLYNLENNIPIEGFKPNDE